MFVERIQRGEYVKLANEFRPERFDADTWVSLASSPSYAVRKNL